MRYNLDGIRDIKTLRGEVSITGDLSMAKVGDEYALRFGGRKSEPLIYKVIECDGERLLVKAGYPTYKID